MKLIKPNKRGALLPRIDASLSSTELCRQTLVLVLAGGEGTRLHNLTKWRSKPSVPFGGKFRIIDFTLSNCINSGLRKIGVLTQCKSNSIIRHLQRGWSFLRAEMGEFVEVLPAQQKTKKEWYKGTADALYQNIDIIRRHNPQYVLVLGGDHIYAMDYSKMLIDHVSSGADLTVGCTVVPRDEARHFGVMSVDSNFRVTQFAEKPDNPEGMPEEPDLALTSMGIYIFSNAFLQQRLITDALDDSSSHDFGRDIIPKCIDNAITMAYPFVDNEGEPAYWLDVGNLDSYWKANIDLCSIEPKLNLYNKQWPIWTYQVQAPPAKFIFDDQGRRGVAIDSLVSGGCIISGAQVKRSVIFTESKINSYSTVTDSVILPKVTIGRNCKIKHAIIDKGAVVEDGTNIGIDHAEDKKRFHVTEGGIVLVTPEMLGQSLYGPSLFVSEAPSEQSS